MRDATPPFQFDISGILARAKRLPAKLDGVTLHLPFIDVAVKPQNVERRVAREVVIRLADHRILNASECCDSCIEEALRSLQDIRTRLVDKQVELADSTDGALYLLLELMLAGIRQFLTFEQRLVPRGCANPQYFTALEMLRAHLYRCLAQVATIADTTIPRISEAMRYDDAWQVDAYTPPALSEPT